VPLFRIVSGAISSVLALPLAKDLWRLKRDIFHLNIEWRFFSYQVSYNVSKMGRYALSG